uniref:Runt domain-containing protein n=1 Tax=Steinernema glaseri TaxID=37863 RepID=A0A1I7Y3H9_9BILA
MSGSSIDSLFPMPSMVFSQEEPVGYFNPSLSDLWGRLPGGGQVRAGDASPSGRVGPAGAAASPSPEITYSDPRPLPAAAGSLATRGPAASSAAPTRPHGPPPPPRGLLLIVAPPPHRSPWDFHAATAAKPQKPAGAKAINTRAAAAADAQIVMRCIVFFRPGPPLPTTCKYPPETTLTCAPSVCLSAERALSGTARGRTRMDTIEEQGVIKVRVRTQQKHVLFKVSHILHMDLQISHRTPQSSEFERFLLFSLSVLIRYKVA